MKRRAPREVCGQSRILLAGHSREDREIGAGPGTEAVEIVDALDGQKKNVDGRGNFAVVEKASPQSAVLRRFKPQKDEQENSARDHIEASGQTGEQIESQRHRADEERPNTACTQPVIL